MPNISKNNICDYPLHTSDNERKLYYGSELDETIENRILKMILFNHQEWSISHFSITSTLRLVSLGLLSVFMFFKASCYLWFSTFLKKKLNICHIWCLISFYSNPNKSQCVVAVHYIFTSALLLQFRIWISLQTMVKYYCFAIPTFGKILQYLNL